jgi:hypothetical protein
VRLGGATLDAKPRLRFSDHQPFLGRDDYLAVKEVRVGQHSYGPGAGNARLDRNVLALDQLELAALGGRITGQCLVDYSGNDPEIEFRGHVTGVRPSGPKTDDRLDANAALRFAPRRMELEGRAEIVRIARRHLMDLIDVWDPYRADVSANRARLALKVGYPKQVRLRFHEGFAAAGIELGGLAGLVHIEEMRGVPVGPLVERYLGDLLRREDGP